MKIMHISPIRWHPCFTELIKEQSNEHTILFVKLDLIEKDKSYEVVNDARDDCIRIKNIKKCCDQNYDSKLNIIFNKLLIEHKPDIIHLHVFSGISLLSILNAASSLDIKKILTLHDHSLLCIKGLCYNKDNKCELTTLAQCDCQECLEHAFKSNNSLNSYNQRRKIWIESIINQCDKIICPSNYQKKQMTTLFGKDAKIIYLYYGIRLPKFKQEQKKMNMPVFGYLGTTSWIKGIRLIEEAIEKLKDYNFRILMGFSKLSHQDNAFFKKIDKNNKIIIKQDISRNALYHQFFSQIDYLIIPSIWNETGPMTLLESFYYKVPVIISNNESMVEKIRENKSSIVFNSIDELVSIMKQIINGDIKKEEKDLFVAKNIAKYSEEINGIYKDVMAIKQKGLFLKLGYECNNNCIFCVTGDNYPRKFIDFKIIEETLRKNSKKYDSLVLTGGEPTIRKDFFKILELAYRLGYKILLQTNARMFSYETFCDNLKGYNLKFSINVNSPDFRIHDETTGVKGSFAQTIKGMQNLQKHGSEIFGKIMLTRINYRHVLKTVKFMAQLGIKDIWIVFLTPYGSAKTNFNDVIPKYSQVLLFVNQALLWAKENSNIKIGLEGFPYCCINQEFRQLVTEENFNKDSLQGIYAGDDNYEYNCKSERVFSQKQKFDNCNECRYNNKCEGIYKEYVKNNGKGEFKPIK